MKYLTEVPKALLGCSVDPLTIGTIAAGAAGLFGGLFAGSKSGGAAPAAAPAAPAAQQDTIQPTAQPSGGKPTPKSQAPTFLGSAAVPQAAGPVQSGQKTLLGQ